MNKIKEFKVSKTKEIELDVRIENVMAKIIEIIELAEKDKSAKEKSKK